MSAITFFSPAKLNLFLAVTGRRSDGYHELVSVAAPLTWGDTLHTEPGRGFTLECDDALVPVDDSNLVLQAAAAFARATGWTGGAAFRLEKRIPMGAGLGGGSSNAVAALRALNQLAGHPLDMAALAGLAAQLGSDCPLFLHGAPVVMRGRGERVEPLAAMERTRLTGRRVLVFKPAFGIATAWAYQRLAARSGNYRPAAEAEAQLAQWRSAPAAPVEALLCNNLETAVFGKFMALPALLAELGGRFGLTPRMSGSGSACYVVLPDAAPVPAIAGSIRAAWGTRCFIRETAFA